MSKEIKHILCDILVTIFILVLFFFISLAIHTFLNTQALIPTLFVLSVFLISMYTTGYFYGIIAALISVLAVNFAFTFPYFSFNFTIQENIISAIVLIFVTVSTSTLTTKIKKQEQIKLEAEKEKMRADLLRAVSHDLRTPLTSIYGSASTVAENYYALTDARKLDILRGIGADAQWLIRMVENHLSITKIDNSNVKLLKNPVVLEELVDSVLAKFKKRYPDQNVICSIPDEFVVISADPILVEQVLINILENAVQHAVGMTELKLIVSIVDSKVVFDVADNGCGIEKEKLKNIFTGYYIDRDKPSDNQKRCMGIGLSVCAAIIKAHGGEISAQNLRTGGMIFTFTLEKEETEYE